MKFATFTCSLLILFLIPFLSHAQLSKSKVSFGGDFTGKRYVRYYGSTYSPYGIPRDRFQEKLMNFSGAISLSYFVLNNFSAGIYTTVGLDRHKYYNGTIARTNSFNVGPMLRYYYRRNHFLFFGHGHLQYGIEAHRNEYPNNGSPTVRNAKFDFRTLGIGPGVSYLLNEKVSIESLLLYNRNLLIGRKSYVDNETYSENNFTVQLGFHCYLNRPW